MSAPIIFNGRRAKLLTVDGILNKDGSINDFDGLINYVANGHGEVDTSGWATYADAAGSVPVDGTGGSPTLTFTRTTSSPLRGVASFLITKDAANRQGEGASYDLTIDAADRAQMLQISADVEVASGTYDSGSSTANSDLIAYIYDVTNARLIEPAGMKIQSGVKLKATFQTSSDSVSYRLIFHQSLTGTSAYTLKLDNIVVGPQVTASGYAGYDLKDAGTVSSSWVTNATHTAKEGRRGDMGIFQFQTLVTGAPTSATYTLTLPNGRVMDTSKMIQTESGGGYLIPFESVRILDSGNKYYTGKVSYASSTSVQVDVFGQTSTNIDIAGQVTQAVPMTFANGDRISVSVEVPIVGWSSNTVASSETDTRVVSFNGTQASQAVTADVTPLTLTAVKDSHGAWSTNTYTVKVPGDYVVCGVGITSSAATIRVWKNGVAGGYFGSSPGVSTATGGSVLLPNCVVGDTIQVRLGTSVTVTLGNISIFRLSGPAQITAEATIAVEAENIAGTSIPNNTLTILAFNTITGNTNGAWSGTVFTAPVSGRYNFNAHTLLNAYTGWVLTEALELTLHKNNSGTALKYLYYNNMMPGGGANVNISASGNATIALLAGETVDIRLKQVSGAAITLVALAGTNRLEILRVGNY